MRMHFRTNAFGRLAACGDWFIPTDDFNRNVNDVLKERDFLKFPAIFGNNNPVYLEIGCGQGKFACETARRNPSINVLAVEKMSNVILTGVEEAAAEEIPNVRFMRAQAECLPKYIPSGSIEKIILNFSTPLPKKGYAKQRLTSDRFLSIYADLLGENGAIEQKTDDRDFYLFSVERLEANGFIVIERSENLHANGEVGIITEYERKFISLGLPIYRLKAVKKGEEKCIR